MARGTGVAVPFSALPPPLPKKKKVLSHILQVMSVVMVVVVVDIVVGRENERYETSFEEVR